MNPTLPTASFRSALTAQDAIPYEAALDRLVRGRVVSDDQLMDYELSQALRGIAVAVKSPALGFPCPALARTGSLAEAGEGARTIFGREAVLYRVCVTAVANPNSLPTLLYLSVRLLCDAATAYGEGNERPCCTPEWSQALLSCVSPAADVMGESGLGVSEAFSSLTALDRRFQLGHLRIVAGTLRMVASGAVASHNLFTHFVPLARAVVLHLLPAASMLAEGRADYFPSTSALAAATTGGGDAAEAEEAAGDAPSLLTADANNFVVQCTHWLCVDALHVHMEGGDQGRPPSTRRVLDREAPQTLWSNVPRVRSALLRSFVWLEKEMKWQVRHWQAEEQRRQQHHHRHDGQGEDPRAMATRGARTSPAAFDPHAALSLVRAARHHVDAVLSGMLKEQERLDVARLSAVQRYGASAKDVHQLADAMWSHTLHLCFVLQSLTGAWVGVHGGLGLGATTSGVVFASQRDVLVFLAGCVSRLPTEQQGGAGRNSSSSSSSSRAHVSVATEALLTAVVALAAAAPLSVMQQELWTCEGGAITRELHGALTQRGLRFKDTQVLQLTSLLMNSIMNTASTGGGGALVLASETADQLMHMLSESRDAASHVAVELLMSAVAQRPHVLIPALFRLLKSGDASARANALDVLSGLPQVVRAAGVRVAGKKKMDEPDAVGAGGAATVTVDEERLRDVLRLLAEELLLHLHDDELVTRMQSARLFAKVWPEDVLYPLLNMALQRDPRGVKQSAAKAALTSVMQAHSGDADVVLALLRDAYQLLRATRTSSSSPLRGEEDRRAAIEDGGAATVATSPSRAAPTTPGEILTKSLLYTTTSEAGGDSQALPEGVGTTGSGSAVKGEHLHRLVSSLCKTWASASTTTPQQHLSSSAMVPLLHHLRTITEAETQQFFVRHATALLSALTTCRAGEGESEPQAQSCGAEAVVEAIWHAFFSRASPSDSAACETSPWLQQLAEEAKESSEASGAVASEASLYQILLPLLCLRSCDRSCFKAMAEQPPRADDHRESAAERVLECIWAALLTEPYMSIFRHPRHNDLQRVLLEVACKAPPRVFFARVGACDEAWGETADITGAGSLFLGRVAVFAVCSYLSALPWERHAGASALLAQCAAITRPLWRAVLKASSSSLTSTKLARHQPFTALQQGLLDSVALVTLQALYLKDGDVFAEVQGSILGATFASNSSDNAMDVSFVPAIHEHMLMIIRGHPAASELLLLWLTHFQQPLIALANAACKHEARPCPTAVACGELLFRAVMLSSKMEEVRPGGPATAASPHVVDIHAATAPGRALGGGSNDPPSFLQRHADRVDCTALVSFGMGCARARYGVPLQQLGVRLLAALLGAALDRLLTLEPSPLEDIGGLLRNIALIHEDGATRQLAEQVLRSLPALDQVR